MATLADAPVSLARAYRFAEYGRSSDSGWTEAVRSDEVSLLNFLGRQFRMSVATRQFLRERPVLLWSLLDAQSAIGQAFGRDVDLSLEVVRDPEIENAAARLFGYIATPAPIDRALDALREFDRRWTLRRNPVEAEQLAFDLAF